MYPDLNFYISGLLTGSKRFLRKVRFHFLNVTVSFFLGNLTEGVRIEFRRSVNSVELFYCTTG